MSKSVASGSFGDHCVSASYDVFISHKSEYKPWVEWLGRALGDQGLSVFLDLWNLIPGEKWVEGLHRGIERCHSALPVATPEVVNSGWVCEEYYALQRRMKADPNFRLIPIVFGEIPNLPFLGQSAGRRLSSLCDAAASVKHPGSDLRGRLRPMGKEGSSGNPSRQRAHPRRDLRSGPSLLGRHFGSPV